MGLRIAIGCDPSGYGLKSAILADLERSDLVDAVFDMGSSGYDDHSQDYVDISVNVASKIAAGEADRGLLFCGNGLGVTIKANSVDGVDAVTAHDVLSVRTSLTINRAQVLCMGERIIGVDNARTLVEEWLGTEMPS